MGRRARSNAPRSKRSLVDGTAARAATVGGAALTAWPEDNRQAIDDYNVFVAKHGLFSDGRRRF
jgi:post-segregation antitoxin (ccd killing protein)